MMMIDYFPCTTTFFNDLYVDVRPSKIRKISQVLSSDESSSSSSSSDSDSDMNSNSDSDSDMNSNSDSDMNLNSDSDSDSGSDSSLLSRIDNYLKPDMKLRGEKVDLISLLCTQTRDFLVDKNGRKVSVRSAIEGKYVILIWLNLPVNSFSDAGRTCWALRAACSCSSSNWSNNVQLVVIPSISPGSEQEAFRSFLSGLPGCLAVPLWDSDSDSDSYRISYRSISHPYTIIFDPNQTVLQEDCYLDIIDFGADSYPFTDDRLLTLRTTNRELWREKPFPLERLLGLDLSDCLSNVAGDAKITVSQLKHKLVGVLVTFHFRNFNTVIQAYQDCLAKGRELDIVLACINLEDDPQHYMDSALAAFRQYDRDNDKQILSNWWVLPYNDSTWRRLWRLLNNLHCGEDERIEEMIIVGPRGEFVDPKTLCAMSKDPSIHDMYPYAVQVIAQQETARLQNLTLESLFDDSLLVTQQGNLMPVTELRGKNVLLFIADLENGYAYNSVMDQMRYYWCPEIELKCKVSNTAVVFVPLHSSGLIFTKDLDPRMFWLWDPTISWLISPPTTNHVREALIIKSLSLKGSTIASSEPLSCVAFGEDGQFVSNNLYDLSKYMAKDLPPDHLYYNVLEQYCGICDKDERERWLMGYTKSEECS